MTKCHKLRRNSFPCSWEKSNTNAQADAEPTSWFRDIIFLFPLVVEGKGSSLDSYSWRFYHHGLITSKRLCLLPPSSSRLRYQHRDPEITVVQEMWTDWRHINDAEYISSGFTIHKLFTSTKIHRNVFAKGMDPGMTFGLGVCYAMYNVDMFGWLCLPQWLFYVICGWTEPGPHQAHGTYVGACSCQLCQHVWWR